MLFIKGFLYIPENLFTRELKENLVIPNPDYEKKLRMNISVAGVEQKYVLYTLVNTAKGRYYRVPKYALGNISELIKNYEVKFQHKIVKEDIGYLPPKDIVLSNEQNESIKGIITALEKERGAILVAATGEGKTTMAIKVICNLGLKTIVLCHKDSLIEQWRTSLANLTDLEEDEIGLLQQGKFIDGKVVIGSQASLMRDVRLGKEFNDMFSFKIQDEVHRIGARMFLKAFARFNTKYSLGLSATPTRSDEMERLYFLHTSNNFIRHKNVRSIKSVYFPFPYKRSMKWKNYPRFIPYNIQVLNNITADEDRLNFMANIICSMPNRKHLIVGSRIKHLKAFMEIIQQRLKDKKIERFFGEETKTTRKKIWQFTFKKGETFKVSYNEKEIEINCIGFNRDKTEANLVVDGAGMYIKIEDILADPEHFLQFHIKRVYKKKSQKLETFEQPNLSELHKADIIFATLSKFMDALDFPHLDTLMAITPFSDINVLTQLKGRVERQKKGKGQPLILEIQDVGIKHTTNMFNARERHYEQLGIKRLSVKEFEKIKTA